MFSPFLLHVFNFGGCFLTQILHITILCFYLIRLVFIWLYFTDTSGSLTNTQLGFSLCMAISCTHSVFLVHGIGSFHSFLTVPFHIENACEWLFHISLLVFFGKKPLDAVFDNFPLYLDQRIDHRMVWSGRDLEGHLVPTPPVLIWSLDTSI